MRRMTSARISATAFAAMFFASPLAAQPKHQTAVIDLWTQGKPAFGVYAPNERPSGPGRGGAPSAAVATTRPPMQPPLYTKEGGERLAINPLYDYVFLNLEGAYDPAAVKAISEGLRSPKAVSRKTLIVRIPPIDKDGPDAAKARVKEIFNAGADGVTIPHILSLDEAKLALTFFEAAKANVWSPSNPKGEKLAMLMLEDPKAVEQAREVADLKGLSILACGIGSLTQALGGDRAGAEAGTQKVLVETKRAKIANMLTANGQDIEKRIEEGFLALLMQGPTADETIKIGRAAVGR
jgi:2-keto-3-deoxy-L-rhamnonate aldolase RhmA